MKKFLTLFVCLFLVSLYMTVSAQQKIFVWKDGGIRNIINSEEIDSVSFSVGPWMFDITTPEATAVTTQSFTVSPKVSPGGGVKYLREYVCGICYSKSNNVPTIDDACLQGSLFGDGIEFCAKKLIPNTTYFYRTYVKFLDDVYYGEVMSVTTLKGDCPDATVINEHAFIDLGLPSGLLWADRNVGASSFYDGGEHFAWGETEPKETYNEANYKWWSNGSLTKYNSYDGKFSLEADDDAATVNWGKECCTPSVADFRELIDHCTWVWLQSDYYGPVYRVFGPNGNYIELYCNGFKNESYIAIGIGYYMANSLCDNQLYTKYLFINGGMENPAVIGQSGRVAGLSVRPVAKKR